MEKSRWTIKEAAELLNVKPGTISGWKNRYPIIFEQKTEYDWYGRNGNEQFGSRIYFSREGIETLELIQNLRDRHISTNGIQKLLEMVEMGMDPSIMRYWREKTIDKYYEKHFKTFDIKKFIKQ